MKSLFCFLDCRHDRCISITIPKYAYAHVYFIIAVIGLEDADKSDDWVEGCGFYLLKHDKRWFAGQGFSTSMVSIIEGIAQGGAIRKDSSCVPDL